MGEKKLIKSIRKKLILIMLLIVLVPFVVLNLSNYYSISNGYQRTIESSHLTLAKSLSANVTSFMTNYYKLTEEIANSNDIKNFDHFNQKNVLVDSANRNPDISLYYVQGVDGKQTARSSGSELGDRSQRWWFKKIINDKKPFVSESYFTLLENIPVTSIFIPLYDQQKQFIGVMGTDLKLDALQDIVEDLSSEDGIIAYVIDSKGVVIAHPNKEQVLEQYNYLNSNKTLLMKDEKGNVVLDENGNQKTVTEDIETARELQEAVLASLNGESGYVEYLDFDGNEVISAYTPVKLPGDSDSWGIITVQNKRDSLAFVRNVINKNLLMAIGLMVVVSVVSYFLSKQVTTPLNKLNEAFAEAASGNLDIRAHIESKDEFGEVGENFNIMIENISNLVNEVRQAGNTVLKNSKSLAQITEQATMANTEVAHAIEDIAKGAVDEAYGVELGAVKINELAIKIEEVTQSNKYMSELSNQTNNLSNRGVEVVDLLKDITKENVEVADKVNRIILDMDKSSGEIGQITNTISQIAEQTNLLALNAAIEAARVGENGRGFAVVADEIRKLAEETSNSTNHIKNLIDGVQKQSKEAVNAMVEAEVVVKNQSIQVEETENIFKDIAKSISSLNEEVTQIMSHTQVMAGNKDEIVAMIEDLSAISEETSASTEEVSASVEEQLAAMEEINNYVIDLEKLSQNLTESINRLSKS